MWIPGTQWKSGNVAVTPAHAPIEVDMRKWRSSFSSARGHIGSYGWIQPWRVRVGVPFLVA